MKTRTFVIAGAATIASIGIATGPAEAIPPRPGCGFGDTNHSHQAAPGLDPLNLRPGNGTGDENHPHTMPPGQFPDDFEAPLDPRRGCPDLD